MNVRDLDFQSRMEHSELPAWSSGERAIYCSDLLGQQGLRESLKSHQEHFVKAEKWNNTNCKDLTIDE